VIRPDDPRLRDWVLVGAVLFLVLLVALTALLKR
jgi:hypothetical protein